MHAQCDLSTCVGLCRLSKLLFNMQKSHIVMIMMNISHSLTCFMGNLFLQAAQHLTVKCISKNAQRYRGKTILLSRYLPKHRGKNPIAPVESAPMTEATKRTPSSHMITERKGTTYRID